ncbi:MAG: rubredoxin [Candidatus Electrothrix sp. GW3-4]|uniref:rubredoxin n=1 Tax=Candidatus Electrothrix sp. GW3-4 TaxID=3126740 RepID=UPI0030D12EF7
MTKKYVCTVCGYIYEPEVGDEENDIVRGTEWDNVPEDWTCPICGCEADKDAFELF